MHSSLGATSNTLTAGAADAAHGKAVNRVAWHSFINQHAKNARHRMSPHGTWIARRTCFSPTWTYLKNNPFGIFMLQVLELFV